MNHGTLLQKFAHIRTWKKEGLEAPHKAFVFLSALANVQRGSRWLSFRTMNEPLKRLIERYWEDRQTQLANEPFWRLRNDKGQFWEVRGNVPAGRLRDIDAPTEQELLDWDAKAGFTQDVYDALRQNPQWVIDVAETVYGEHPVGSSRDEVFRAVGLST